MTAIRVTLRTVGARLLWDGRPDECGSFIPGISDYQAGVQALDAAARRHDEKAGAMLAEAVAALSAAEHSVRRWQRGIERFVTEHFGGSLGMRRAWLQEQRAIRVWRTEAERMAQLVVAYDQACALTSLASAQARTRGIFNPHHESIRERAGTIRHVVDLGYGGWVYVVGRLEEENARRRREGGFRARVRNG